MLVIVLLGLVAFGVSGVLSSAVEKKNQKEIEKNIKILSEAKEILLSYAVDYAVRDMDSDGSIDLYRMGKLPCPDVDGAAGEEGGQDMNCGAKSTNSIGLFPFKTLGSGRIVDSANECLWYVVSGDYKNYVDADMLNWDTVGSLKLVDESDNLKHGSSEDDYPIAFIISPGKSIDQNRLPHAALPSCRANFTLANYLEGGPNINYASDLPFTADGVWDLLTASQASMAQNKDFNDQVVAVYKSELWGRVRKLGQLDSDDNSDVDTLPEKLTKQLAECLSDYGNDPDNTNKSLPFAAKVDLSDYRISANYTDDNSGSGLLTGRFPQVIDDSEAPGDVALPDVIAKDDNFASDGSGTGYCNLGDLEDFWENWKDHIFYYVGNDFRPSNSLPPVADRCGDEEDCLTFDSHEGLAAVVFFAGPPLAAQSRIWTTSTDEKDQISNYLEGVNAVSYNGSSATSFVPQDGAHNDYAFCVEFNSSGAYQFSVEKCRDL